MFYMLAIILLHRMDVLCLFGPFPILLSSREFDKLFYRDGTV